MRYKELDVVIEPNEIEFPHVLQNNIYRQIIHVKNVGIKSKRIQIFRPAIKVISLFLFLKSTNAVIFFFSYSGFSINCQKSRSTCTTRS